MVRQRLTGMSGTPLRAATAPGTTVPACQRKFPGTPPATPLPAVASPRAWLTSAPSCDIVVANRLTGATEGFSRGLVTSHRDIGPRAMSIRARATEDAGHDRASESPGVSPGISRCRASKDAADDHARDKWGDVFTTEDVVTGRLRGSGEVVPCPSTTTGTDQLHDILRDSGAVHHAGPGVFLATGGRDTEIPANTEWGNRTRGYRLSGGIFSAGPCARPRAPVQLWT